jgi:hypothetical protein
MRELAVGSSWIGKVCDEFPKQVALGRVWLSIHLGVFIYRGQWL